MASSARVGEEYSATAAPLPWRQQGWAQNLPESVARGAEHLISLQTREGYWLGELEADSTLESDYIYYLHVLGKEEPTRVAKLANSVRSKQLDDGGWSIYPADPRS
jgi:squalene-hopene/tetraprenyl-beta-curcumene cyclase